MLRKVRFLAVLSVLLLLLITANGTFAQTFDISWSSSAYGSGAADFTAMDQGGGQFLLTSVIDGSQAGNPISLLAVNAFGSNDNLVFPSSSLLVDTAGFSFFDGTNDFNISYIGGTNYVECSSADNPTCYYTGVEQPLDSLTVTPTPEPSSMLLFLAGMGLLLIVIARKGIA